MKIEMSKKEFEQILNNAEIDFEVVGYAGILNMISMAYRFLAEQPWQLEPIAKLYKDTCDKIYDELKERGYYE